MKRLILLIAILACAGSLRAAERPTFAVLPFGIAKDRGDLRWMGPAIASTLTEKLRRIAAVRVLSSANVVRELRAAGIAPEQAAWTPAIASGPLGRWLDADLIVVGAVGKTHDRAVADVVLQTQASPPVKGAQIWLAARVVDAHTGETRCRAYVEGKTDDLSSLQYDLLVHLGKNLNLDDALALPAVARPLATDLEAYHEATEAEQIILGLYGMDDVKTREKQIKKATKALQKALSRDPDYAAALTWQGTLYALQNRPELAAKSFESAAARDPAFAAPRYGLVDLALKQDRLQQAATALDSVIAAAPWDDEAYHLKGAVMRRLGHNDRALAAFEKAIAHNPRHPESLYAAGQIHLEYGQTGQAVETLEKAVALMPGDMAYQIALTDALLADGQTDRARAVLDHIAPLAETDPEYQLVRGKLALREGHLDEAVAKLIQAQKAMPDRTDILVTLGKLYVQQTRYADAVETFTAAQAHGAALPGFAAPFGEALEAQRQTAQAEALYRKTLEQTPGNIDLRLRLTKRLLARGARNDAIETLNAGVQIAPDRGDLHRMLGDLYAEQTMNAEAIGHYARARALGVRDPDIPIKLGDLYMAQNQPDSAGAQYQNAINAGARSAALFVKLGRAEEKRDDLRAALTAYRQALKIDPQQPEARESEARLALALRPKPRTPTATDYANRAHDRLGAGDLDGARKAFEKALALAPKNAALWNDLGAVYARQNDLQHAENAFKRAGKNAPNAPEGFYNLGKLYTDMGRLDDAESACREALAIAPDYAPAKQQLGAVYQAQGETKRALTVYQNALKTAPDAPDLLLGLANALLAQGNLTDARQAYLSAQKQRPDASAPEIGLGNISLSTGDTAQAIAHYRKAAERNAPAAFVNIGAIQTARGNFDAAAKAYQKALSLAPNDRDVLANLAILYCRSGQYDDALTYCRTLQERHPDALETRRLTGMVAYAAGKYELAVIAYQSAIDLNPNDPQLHQGLAATYEALKDPAAARTQWQTWLDLVRDNPAYQQEAQRITEHLKTLQEL